MSRVKNGVKRKAIQVLPMETLHLLVEEAAQVVISGGLCPTCQPFRHTLVCNGWPWCPCHCHNGGKMYLEGFREKLLRLGILIKPRVLKRGKDNAYYLRPAERYRKRAIEAGLVKG